MWWCILDSPQSYFRAVVPKRWFVTPFGVTESSCGGSDRLPMRVINFTFFLVIWHLTLHWRIPKTNFQQLWGTWSQLFFRMQALPDFPSFIVTYNTNLRVIYWCATNEAKLMAETANSESFDLVLILYKMWLKNVKTGPPEYFTRSGILSRNRDTSQEPESQPEITNKFPS